VMMKLLPFVGILLALGALVPMGFAIGTHDDISKAEGELAFFGRQGPDSHTSLAIREKRIAELSQQAEELKSQRNLELGAGAGLLVVGLGMAFIAALTAPQKKKLDLLPSAQDEPTTGGEASAPQLS
jgi:hypothetical protein